VRQDDLVDPQGDKTRPLELRILGPVEALLDDGPVHLTGLQRSLLAMLALAGGHVVSTQRLSAGLWEVEPPSAQARVRTLVAELRRALRGGGHVLTRAPGYRADPAFVSVDSLDFAQTTRQAHAAQVEGRLPQAARLYDDALRLWRGPALGGAAIGPFVTSEVSRLDGIRLNAAEELAEVLLALGDPQAAIVALAEPIAQRPPRDRAFGLLMLAHYRSGRAGEALRVYQLAHQVYRDELGLNPGVELTEMRQRILRSDPSLAAVAAPRPTLEPVRPAQLPTDIGDFTGRDAEVAAVSGELAHGAPAPIVALHGRPGVGKSAVATRVAHQLRSMFPHGQIYVDLAGGGPRPADPHDVLGQFLAALGVAGSAIPQDTAARAALYRSILADQRALVFLDNAASATQVRPLLPAADGCAVIVTSRTPVAAPLGARGIEIDLLDADASHRLVATIIGKERAAAEGDDVDRLVDLCGQLPLALRVAAGRLAESPHWQVATLVERLRNERQRLHELHHGGVDLHATLQMSHRALSPRAADGLRLLGVPPSGTFASWVLAALLGVPDADAGTVIDELIRAGLLDYSGRDGTGAPRYRLHDLIRAFAVGLADEMAPGDREDAERRLFGAWLAVASQAAVQLPCRPIVALPGPEQPQPVTGFVVSDAIAWFESERVGLRAMVRRAEQRGSAYAYQITASTAKFAELRGHYDDGRAMCRSGLAVALARGDRRAAAYMLYGLAAIDRHQDRLDDARQGYEQARAAFVDVGDAVGISIADAALAVVLRMTGDVPGSIALSNVVIAAFTTLGEEVRAAQARYSAAVAYCDAHDWDAAAALLLAALPVLEAAGDGETRCRALGVLGFVHLRRGEYGAARWHLERSVAVSGEVGLLVDGVYARMMLSQMHAEMGCTEQAHDTINISLQTMRAIGDRSGESRILMLLAELYVAEDRLDEAIEVAEQAVRITRVVGNVLAAKHRQEWIENLRARSGR
jgi:DNA-binding SARP family transcriptional activator